MITARRLCILGLVAQLFVVFCIPATAEESADEQKDWRFQLAAFYLWGFTLSVDQTVGNNTEEVDASITERHRQVLFRTTEAEVDGAINSVLNF